MCFSFILASILRRRNWLLRQLQRKYSRFSILLVFSISSIFFPQCVYAFRSAQQAQNNAAAAAIHASVTLKGQDDTSLARQHTEEVAMNHNYESEFKPAQQSEYELAGY